jgi:hypothetical protein
LDHCFDFSEVARKLVSKHSDINSSKSTLLKFPSLLRPLLTKLEGVSFTNLDVVSKNGLATKHTLTSKNCKIEIKLTSYNASERYVSKVRYPRTMIEVNALNRRVSQSFNEESMQVVTFLMEIFKTSSLVCSYDIEIPTFTDEGREEIIYFSDTLNRTDAEIVIIR